MYTSEYKKESNLSLKNVQKTWQTRENKCTTTLSLNIGKRTINQVVCET